MDLVHVEWWEGLKRELFAAQRAREGRRQGARDSGRGGDAGGVCTPGWPTDRGGVLCRQGTSSGRGEGSCEVSCKEAVLDKGSLLHKSSGSRKMRQGWSCVATKQRMRIFLMQSDVQTLMEL